MNTKNILSGGDERKFCSRKCSNSRVWTEKDKKIKSESAKKSEKNKLAIMKRIVTRIEKKCIICSNSMLIREKDNKKYCSKECRIIGLSKFRSEWLKIPENRKNYGRGKRSWMEIKFIEYLNKENIIGWEDEVHFWNEKLKKNYFVDFVFEDKKLIIELDGTQHRNTIEQDKIRDEYMNSLGYKVKRIPYEEFKKRIFHDGFNDIM